MYIFRGPLCILDLHLHRTCDGDSRAQRPEVSRHIRPSPIKNHPRLPMPKAAMLQRPFIAHETESSWRCISVVCMCMWNSIVQSLIVALPASTIPVVLPASERYPRVSETFHLISSPTRHVELGKCSQMIKCHGGRDLGVLLVPDLPQARVICVKQHLQGSRPPRRPLCQPSEAAGQTSHFHSLKRSCTPALARGDQPMLERPKIPGGGVFFHGGRGSCIVPGRGLLGRFLGVQGLDAGARPQSGSAIIYGSWSAAV